MPGRLTRNTSTSLRAWQRHALDRLAEWQGGPFLISAAPGAGKTRPALELAAELLARRVCKSVVVLPDDAADTAVGAPPRRPRRSSCSRITSAAARRRLPRRRGHLRAGR